MRYLLRLSLICLVIIAGLTACSDEPTPDVLGCTDPSSSNYNPDATKDDGSCTNDILGCTNPDSFNYNPDATKDDGSCVAKILGCTDPDAFNYNPDANTDDGSCVAKVFGCTDPDSKNYNPDANVDDGSCTYDIPSTYTQKILVEEVSGAWCGWCPDGVYYYDQIKAIYPENMILLSEHRGDDMELPNYNSGISNIGYPSAMINRVSTPGSSDLYLSRGDWQSATQNILAQGDATIGLSIHSEFDGNTLNITTYVGFGADQTSTSYKLYIMLLEDKVTGAGSGYNQENYTNNDPNSPFYQLGSPIIGYEHPDVLRNFAQNKDGIEIAETAVKEGGRYSHSTSFNVSSYTKGNLKIVAFVTKWGSSVFNSPIVNAQEGIAGQNKAWD